MAIALQISESTAEELRTIAAIPDEKLSEFATALEGVSTILPRQELLKMLRDTIGPSQLNSRLLSNLASLNLLRDDPDQTPESILDALVSGCKASGNEDLAESLVAKQQEIIRLLSSEALFMSIKASQLFTLDSQHIHDLKIVCDARPLFNPNRDDFPAAILYSILNITAGDASENEKRYSFALRYHELDDIIEECERAKRKLSALKKDLSSLDGKNIVQYGDID